MVRFSLLLTGLSLAVPALLFSPIHAEAQDANQGKLTLTANGEDFVRQGFITKDGWQIDFDHVYVTVNEVKAYQTDPPFNPTGTEALQPIQEVTLVDTITTIDLAEGDSNAAPITIAQIPAPAGSYNALSWQLETSPNGEAAGHTILLLGQASKDGETINFSIGLDQPITYTCGEYIGEDRKGILSSGGEADLEITFHFDHIFGDADTDPQDALNTAALGFTPLANLAQGNTLTVTTTELEEKLSPADYQSLATAIASLGHVGEGHCR